ncbi:hypothetical protein FA95DRAFT_1524753 [Auriscalpium vulgare]|uniref:Uncharacterized protein n=1 Tax=Auriscalpium vulgare TaxID=40419 RepID=A0ACB8RGB5_9AGAM|nr:hypothetical protein FA95DRAFT_1524753 [Auriscalpium vulgare]
MKRTPTGARSISPTNTTYSGISNYRTDSYRPLKDRNAPASPAVDPRIIARTHYDELSKYLASYLAKEPANSRSTARQKLTRLTRQQFQELSTDVYDELIRRKNNADSNDIPFLPVRDDFHPKRNQARQKLATLPTSRFKDLSSDVYYELVRRYPEFKEEYPLTDASLTSPGSTYDDFPSPDFPNSPRTKEPLPPFPGRPSLERDRPPSNPNNTSDSDPYNSRRRPSQDTTSTLQQDLGRRPSVASASDSTSTTNAQSATATSGMIIPNKSTIAEEDIEVPYARRGGSARDRESESEGDVGDEPGGLSGLAQRLRGTEDDEPGLRSGGDEYFDKMSFGRGSVASDRSAKGAPGAGVGGRASAGASVEEERMRRDYEYRIATMQNKIAGLEREVEDREEWERKAQESNDRVSQLEEELNEVRRRAEEQGSAMRAMQKELDDLREEREHNREREARRTREDEEELAILRERCDRLEEERDSGAAGGADAELVEQLRADMEGLIAEVSDLSRRNDELMTSKDSDLIVIRDLDAQLKEYKRKYEQAKTELRSVKATSQLFLQKPKFDSDQLPISSEGLIPDVHLTAFLAAIDALLSAARAPAPTRVLTPMKSVVNAVTAIVEDVRGAADTARAEATLGNLVAAARTHATSAGLAPVSLLDAAASHVSAAITELGRTVRIRRATKAEQEGFAATGGSSAASAMSYSPALKSVAEDVSSKSHQRGQSEISSSSISFGRRSEDRDRMPPPPPSMSPPGRPPSGRSAGSDRFRSDPSSSDASSPPPIFDNHPSATGVVSDDSAMAEGSEDAWTELKPYLEAQTESIVYAIQSVLSGVRSPTPSPTLNENLTQIITIVSSIVAVCHDNLPASSARQGSEILRELSEHANKLSEMQALPEVTKESRQIMAKSSFAIANAMKGLQKL